MKQNDAKKRSTRPRSQTRMNQEESSLLWHFESMDRVNRAMQGTNDIEQVMKDVLDTLLDVFQCDRSWLVYPCDPDSPAWQVFMERTRPDYPSVIPLGVEFLLDPAGAETFRMLRNSNVPVKFGANSKYPVPQKMKTEFGVQAFIAMATYPKIGKPWSFGLHQCSYARVWTSEEEKLLQEIGRRLSDTLTSLLTYRELQESEAQIKQLISFSPVAMLVASGSEERVDFVNDRFTELFGYTVEEMPDVMHWWPLAYPDVAYRETVKMQWEARTKSAVNTRCQIEPMEAMVTCKDGSHRYVEFRLSSIGEKRIVTFVDLTEHRKTEEALRESEGKFRSFVEESSEGFTLVDEQGAIIEWNHAREKMTGLPASQVIGQNLWDVLHQMLQPELQTPERYERNKRPILNALKTGKSPLFENVLETEVVRQNGEHQFIQQTIFPIKTDKGYRMGSVTRDVTERKRAEDALRQAHNELEMRVEQRTSELKKANKQLATLYEIAQAITAPLQLNVVLDEIVRSTVKLFDTDTGVILLLDEAREELTIQGSFGLSEKVAKGTHDRVGESIAGRVAQTGQPIIANDLPNDPHFYNPSAEDEGWLACASVPLVARGKIIGTLDVHSKINRFAFNQEHIEILNKLAKQAAVAIENTRLYEQLQLARTELEARVQQRTEDLVTANTQLHQEIRERKQTERSLRESEERFRRLAENARDVIYRMSIPDGKYEYVSTAALSVFGYSPEECYESPMLIKQAIHPDWQMYFEEQWANLIKGEMPPIYEYQFIHKSGKACWLNQRNILVRDDDGIPIAIEGIVTDVTERKQVEEALTLFRTLIDHTNDAIEVVDPETGYFLDANEKAYHTLGYTREELLSLRVLEINPLVAERSWKETLNELRRTGFIVRESQRQRKDGSIFPVEINISYTRLDRDYILAVVRDITERKQAEQSLRESEERFRSFVENANDIVYTISLEGVFTYVSPNWKEMLGHETSEVEGKSFEIFVHPDDLAACRAILNRTIASGEKQSGFEYRVKHKNGSWQWHTSNASVIRDGEGRIASFLGIARNITERKRNERELIILNRAINRSSDAVFLINEQLTFVYVNDIACRSLGYTREELLTMGPSDIDAVITYDAAKDIMSKQFANGHYATFETQHKTRDGRIFPVEIGSSVVEYDGAKFSLTTVRDITERKQAEENLHLQSTALEAAANGITISDHEGIIIWANSAFSRLTGYSIEEVIGKNPRIFKSGKQDTAFYKNLWDTILSGNVWHGELINRRKDGKLYAEEMTIAPVYRKHEKISHFIAIKQDVSERKHSERERESIIAVSTALRHTTTRVDILNVILDQLIDLFDADGAILVLPDPQTKGFIDEMGRGIVGERMTGLHIPPGQGVCNWVVTNKKPYLNNHAENDPFFYRPDLLGDSHCIGSVPLITQNQVIGALWIARKVDILEQDMRLLTAIADIAANAIRRVMLYEQTELQLHHLLALHQIDIAISNNFDSNITLNVILNNVKGELEVDAVSILLLDPVTHTLDYAAGIGFKTLGIEQSHVKLGDGCAGRAAQEYRTVSCPDIGQAHEAFTRSSLLAGEEFTMHYATPLVVKGQVKGVLELFHRKVFEPDKEWLDYYEALATQAAIAIESASLLENLQRSNSELMLAYDATIEGWSRALDLRDKETEGHTQRVTDMALELAGKIGISNTEKQNLWRGSLLHDIGKMGVPDSILLKPGQLTDDERAVMRQHPLYAYQMLSPISYLKYALDIPYCHHEKWDGTGYPRGLKGEEIPLPARVFAVVDVYDALTTDRPYRKALSINEVYHYIQEQAGKQFDPQVVKIFLESRSH